jgi:hypothetical protein
MQSCYFNIEREKKNLQTWNKQQETNWEFFLALKCTSDAFPGTNFPRLWDHCYKSYICKLVALTK